MSTPNVANAWWSAAGISVWEATIPEVPTFAEAGFPGVTTTSWFGFSAAAAIPEEVAGRWEAEIGAALATDFVKERFATSEANRRSSRHSIPRRRQR